MSFLRDYLKYNENNECPDMYHVWAGLTVLSVVVGPKVYYDHGFFQVYCNLYICLVGEQGDRKSVAKDIAFDMLKTLQKMGKANFVMSSECDTKEGITKFMTLPEQSRTFRKANGEVVTFQPYHIFANELKLYIAVNPSGMVDFLTSIYDRTGKGHNVRTKNKGFDEITNPYVTFMVCETPKWLIDRLKDSIISGGFCRRLIFAYSSEHKPPIAYPSITPEAKAAYKRCIEWLDQIKDIEGCFKLTPEAHVWFEEWYAQNYHRARNEPNEFLRGYLKSKHIQLFKVAMLIAVGEPEILKDGLFITKPHLLAGLTLLEQMEANLPRLIETIGRNELAYIAQGIVQMVENAGGIMKEKDLRAQTFNNLQTAEFFSVLQTLTATDKLYRLEKTLGSVKQVLYLTPAKFKEFNEAKEKLTAQAQNAAPSSPPSASPEGK